MSTHSTDRVSTGIDGLDEILDGGLISGSSYLIRGEPGTGKTTLGLHFLAAGAKQGQENLLITLVEPEEKLRQNAQRMGFSLENIHILDLSPTSETVADGQFYDIFSPEEVEKETLLKNIVESFQSIRPNRIYLDSFTQISHLLSDTFQFRQQVLSLMRFIIDKQCTFLFSSEAYKNVIDEDLQFMSDGVINVGFRNGNRIISISKFRGSNFLEGNHAIRLGPNGMSVFPKLIYKDSRANFVIEPIPCGVPELDEMFHGGLERGTNTVISGPSGVGKTTLGAQFIKEAAGRGEHSAIYTFEEGEETLLHRCESINIPINKMVEKGTLSVKKVDPLQYSPGEFAYSVRQTVEEKCANIVMLDSISGYRLSFQNEPLEEIIRHLYSLTEYLKNRGVTVLLIDEVRNITGITSPAQMDISHLADNIICLRYLEIEGKLNKIIGVLKKRMSDFEKSFRLLEITSYGIKVSGPLEGSKKIVSVNSHCTIRD